MVFQKSRIFPTTFSMRLIYGQNFIQFGPCFRWKFFWTRMHQIWLNFDANLAGKKCDQWFSMGKMTFLIINKIETKWIFKFLTISLLNSATDRPMVKILLRLYHFFDKNKPVQECIEKKFCWLIASLASLAHN